MVFYLFFLFQTVSSLKFLTIWDSSKKEEGNTGKYQCVAANKQGKIKSNVAEVYVKCKLNFLIETDSTLQC